MCSSVESKSESEREWCNSCESQSMNSIPSVAFTTPQAREVHNGSISLTERKSEESDNSSILTSVCQVWNSRSDARSVELECREEPRTVLNTPETVSGDEIVRERISPYDVHREESSNSWKSNKLTLIEDERTTIPDSPMNDSRRLFHQVPKTSNQLENILLGNVTYVHFTSDAIDTQRSHNIHIPNTLSREKDVQNYREEKQDQGNDANPVNVRSNPWSRNSKKCKTKYLKRHSDMAQANVLLSEISDSRGSKKSSLLIRKLASCTNQEASQFFTTTCFGYIFCNNETEDCFRDFMYMRIRRMLPFMSITIGVVFILTLVLSPNNTHNWSGCLFLVAAIGELVIGIISTFLFLCGNTLGKGKNNQTLNKGHRLVVSNQRLYEIGCILSLLLATIGSTTHYTIVGTSSHSNFNMREAPQIDQGVFCIETIPALFLVPPVVFATIVRCRAIFIVPIIALTPLCMFAFRSYVIPYPLALLSEHFFRPTLVTLISAICIVQLLVAEGRLRCLFYDTILLHAEAERVSQQQRCTERKPSIPWSPHSLRRVISFNRTIYGTLAILDVCDFAEWSCTQMPDHVVNCMITLHTAFDETLRALHVKKLRHTGSRYIFAAGINDGRHPHESCVAVITAALAMLDTARKINKMLQNQQHHNGRVSCVCPSLKVRVCVHHGPITAVYTHHRVGNDDTAATTTPTATMIGGDAHAVLDMLRHYAPSDAVVCTTDVKRIYNGVFTDMLCGTITRRDRKSEPIRYYRITQAPHSVHVPTVEPREGLQFSNAVVDNNNNNNNNNSGGGSVSGMWRGIGKDNHNDTGKYSSVQTGTREVPYSQHCVQDDNVGFVEKRTESGETSGTVKPPPTRRSRVLRPYGTDNIISPTKDDGPVLVEKIDVKAEAKINVNPLSLDCLQEKCKSKYNTTHLASHTAGQPDLQNKFSFSGRSEPIVIPFSDNLPEVSRGNGLPGFLLDERVDLVQEVRKVSFNRRLYRSLLRCLGIRRGRRLDYDKEDEDNSVEEVAFKEFTLRYDAKAILAGHLFQTICFLFIIGASTFMFTREFSVQREGLVLEIKVRTGEGYKKEWGKLGIVAGVFGMICVIIRPLLFFLCRRNVLSHLASLLLFVDVIFLVPFLLNAPFSSANKDIQYLCFFMLLPLHFMFNQWVVSGLFLTFVGLLIAFGSLHYSRVRFSCNVFAVIFPALTAAHAITVFQRVNFMREQFKMYRQSHRQCKEAQTALVQQQHEEEEKHRWSGLLPPHIMDVAMAMCLKLMPDDMVYVQPHVELCVCRLRMDGVTETAFHMKDSVALFNFLEGINGELDNILHECNTHHAAVLKEKIRQRMIKENVDYTTQQQYMEDNVALDRLVAKMFITEGTWQFAGPLDDDSNYPPYMQELVLQEAALCILSVMHKTQESKFLQTSSLEGNTIHNHNHNTTTITSQKNNNNNEEQEGYKRKNSFRMTSVASVGYAFGVLSSSYCPSLELCGPVVRDCGALMKAAPCGFVGVNHAFARTAALREMREAKREGTASIPTVWDALAEEERICMNSCSSCCVNDMELVSRGAWRVRGCGVQRMFALLPTSQRMERD